MKIKFKSWTWGMQTVEDIVNKTIEILNTKDWTEEEANTIYDCFMKIEDNMESLKEQAWGEDA